jgi:hypothetical protein
MRSRTEEEQKTTYLPHLLFHFYFKKCELGGGNGSGDPGAKYIPAQLTLLSVSDTTRRPSRGSVMINKSESH